MTATVRQPNNTEYGEPNRVEAVSAPLELRLVRATDGSGRRHDFMVCVLHQKDGLPPAVLSFLTEKQMRESGNMTKMPSFVEAAVLRTLGITSSSEAPTNNEAVDAIASSLPKEPA